MKKLLRIVGVLFLLLVVGVVVLYFYRNSLVRAAVERQANASLGVKTELGGVSLGIFGGEFGMTDLKIGSPKGYDAPQMFELGGTELGVNYSELTQNPVKVKRIVIDRPKTVLEYRDGKFNFQALMDQMAGAKGPGPTQPGPGPGQPQPQPQPQPKKEEPKTADGKPAVKLIINELSVKDAEVVIRAPGILPQDLPVKIPTINLKEIGNSDGAQNGAAIREVIGVIMSAVAAQASNSKELMNFDVLKQQMAAQAQQVMGQVSAELQKQVAGFTGEINKGLQQVVPGVDVNKTVKDITGKDAGSAIDKGLQDGMKGLLGGEKEKKEKSKK